MEKNGTPASPATAREQRLARTGGTHQKDALRRRSSEARVPLGLLEEVHDLDELVLGLLDVCDVLEGDPGIPLPITDAVT